MSDIKDLLGLLARQLNVPPSLNCILDEIEVLQAARAQGEPSSGVPEGWRDVVERAVDALGIMAESEGIAGWHLNGDIASWDEGDLPGIRDELQALLIAAPTPEAGQSGGEKVVWLGNGDKLVADIYGADGSWAGVGIFQPTDGQTHGIGEPDGRIDGQPVDNSVAYPLLSIRSHKPESLQVVIDELQESLDRMGYTHPHTNQPDSEQGGDDEWIPVEELTLDDADYAGNIWGLDCDGDVCLLVTHQVIEGWHPQIVSFQRTGLTRPQPPKSKESE